MATRFYLPSSGAGAVSPAYSSRWEDTSIGANLKCVTTKISSAMTTVSFVDVDDTDKDILFRQYVSDPITAQTIAAQNIRWQARGLEVSTLNNLLGSIDVRVVSGDGTTVRGTVFSSRAGGGEFSAVSLRNQFVQGTSTEVISSDGDRIVIEVGYAGNPGVGGTHSGSLSLGDDSGTDLPEDSTETNPYNPWVNFANTLTFQTSSSSSSSSSRSSSSSSRSSSSSSSSNSSSSSSRSSSSSSRSSSSSSCRSSSSSSCRSSSSSSSCRSSSSSSSCRSSSSSSCRSSSSSSSSCRSSSSSSSSCRSSSSSSCRSSSSSSCRSSSSSSSCRSSSSSSCRSSSSSSSCRSSSSSSCRSSSSSSSSCMSSSSSSSSRSSSSSSCRSSSSSSYSSSSSCRSSSSSCSSMSHAIYKIEGIDKVSKTITFENDKPNDYVADVDADLNTVFDRVNRGFKPMRVTTAQRDAITSYFEGQIVYNVSTNKLNFRTTAGWEAITST